jgi:hypothetical protein
MICTPSVLESWSPENNQMSGGAQTPNDNEFETDGVYPEKHLLLEFT